MVVILYKLSQLALLLQLKMTNKICEICKQVIQPNENYCRLTDYKNGEIFMECFYHTTCYNSQIKGTNPQQKMAEGLLNKAQSLMNQLQGKPKEVYQVT